VFRGVQTSANATVNITLNDNTSNYATGSALFSVANVKSAVTTNHWSLEIVDTQDTASFAWGYLKGVYTNASNVVTILDSTNAYTQTTALTKMTISVSTGTFTGGTALVYGVN
jgi:predicted transcriptional regulator